MQHHCSGAPRQGAAVRGSSVGNGLNCEGIHPGPGFIVFLTDSPGSLQLWPALSSKLLPGSGCHTGCLACRSDHSAACSLSPDPWMFLVFLVLLRTLFSPCPFCLDNLLDLTSLLLLPIPRWRCPLWSLPPAGHSLWTCPGFLAFRSGAVVLGLPLSALFSCCSSQRPPGFSGLCLPAYPTHVHSAW